ncbi:LuxR C-terminal-related transcriptional regulator [Nocardioides bizhenqiangii]|uniref:LuxR C-terminal-related transcriptional regulator n=1 Tax=Nocardioides bizhenqiangii TaxID=3095076 RepID=A0ABZ0ZVE4_9ACTN|nr:LuxR C-terminal-related transcriptional regulator [Nocardioides sp. HM61]WQQ28284.1 LuxR C-terminal-related transcriptional regulator [Nocardioides sp. HM61]
MLRGRETEQGAIAALLDEAWTSRGGAFVLRGPAGIGKSALLADAVARAEGMLVLRTQGIQSESDLAFSALHQLLLPIVRLVDRLNPNQAMALRVGLGERPASGRNDRFLVYSATLALVAEAAETRPVLCVVDDAQWLDEESANAMLFTARRVGVERVAMIFAARDQEETKFDAPGLPTVALSGLPTDAAQALLEESAGAAVDPGVTTALLEATGGNPLALVELPGALTPEELSGEEPLPASLPVPDAVARAFLGRVRRLAPEVQTFLLVAGAEGSGDLAAIQHAALAQGCDDDALASAEASALVQTRRDRLEFRHPLVRSAVYDAAPTAQRRAVHAALADALAHQGQPDRRAWHRAAAATGPDPAIADELEKVGERAAARGAPAAASAAFERAAALSSTVEAGASRRWRAAEQARLAGHHRRALNLLRAARSLTEDPLLIADLDLIRGAVELVSGSTASAEQVLLGAARDVQALDTGRALQLLVVGAQAAALADHAEAGVEIGRIAAALPRGQTPLEVFFADLLVGCGHYLSGDLAAALEPLRSAVRAAPEFEQSMLLTWGSRAAYYIGDDEAAFQLDSRAVSLARAAGALGDMLPPLQRLALSEILLGHWSSAAAHGAEATRFATETGQPNMASLPTAWLALLAAYRGDTAGLDAHLASADELLVEHPMAVAAEAMLWARAVREGRAGEAGAAVEHLRRVTSTGIALLASLDRVEVAVQAGQDDQAEEWLGPLARFAETTAADWAAARVSHCRALLGPAADAVGHFEQSLAHHRRSLRPFEWARTELAYGELLRRNGRRVDARAHLRTALTTFDDLGAQPWAERARQELRASGEKIRRAPPTAAAQLTAQELQVTKLVAAGLSNREVAAQLFVSPRTVDFHLRNVFTKLGVTSRSQLAQRDLQLS